MRGCAGTPAGTRCFPYRVGRAYLLAPELRAAFAALDDATLLAAASTLLSDVDELLGAGRQHTPLFRSFPDGIPTDTGDDVTSTS